MFQSYELTSFLQLSDLPIEKVADYAVTFHVQVQIKLDVVTCATRAQ